MRGIRTLGCLVSVVIAVAGCGGASDTPPGPLPKHFDDMYIAAVPLDQKQPVVQTMNDWSVAKMEQANAQTKLDEATTQLTIARNDQKAAALGVDSAVSSKKAAEQSADTNRVNQAQKDLHTAEDLKKAAEARVKYLEVYREYIKRYFRYTQENMYWREAQYEGAKAQIAKQNNIAPKGVTYESFPKQLDERQKRTQSSKERAEGDKQKAMSARENWLKVQKTADTEAGRETSVWDPMGAKTGPASAGNVTTNPMSTTGTTGGASSTAPMPAAVPGPAPAPAPAPNPAPNP
jgi:hypothetical protein